MTKLYAFQQWEDWWDRPEWSNSVYPDEIYLSRENIEKALVDHAYRVLQRREEAHNRRHEAYLQHEARHRALVDAGLDPKDYAILTSAIDRSYPRAAEPFDWDDPEHTTLTDEGIGYRIIEIETAD